MISLCQRCAGKISDRYTLVPVRDGESCFLCHGGGATVYEFTTKRVNRPRTASAGVNADRQAYERGRRWA